MMSEYGTFVLSPAKNERKAFAKDTLHVSYPKNPLTAVRIGQGVL
jgi:hypothetical protein